MYMQNSNQFEDKEKHGNMKNQIHQENHNEQNKAKNS